MSAPLFTARIDHDQATIRARGRLDHLSADLLRGTVEALQRGGHRAVTLDVAQLTEPDGAGVLYGILDELSAAGARIVVRRKPSWTTPALP